MVRQPRRRGRTLQHAYEYAPDRQIRPQPQRHRQRHLHDPPDPGQEPLVRHERRTDTGRTRHDAHPGHHQHRARHPRRPQGRPLAEHQPRTGAVHAPHGQRGDLRVLLRPEYHRIQRRSLLHRPADGAALLRRHQRAGHRRGNRLRGTVVQPADPLPRRAPQRRGAQHRQPALRQGRADAAARAAHLRDHGIGTRLRQRQQLHLLHAAGRVQRPMDEHFIEAVLRRPAARHLPARRTLPQ